MENKTEWHLSKYNLFAKHPYNENKIIIMNLLNRKFTDISKEDYEKLSDFEKIQEDDFLFKVLKSYNFIINFDEIEYLKTITKNDYSRQIDFTICPTLDCNFDCLYCFENRRKGKMNKETQDRLIKFIKNIINSTGVTKFHVTWFGGEPLLAVDIIESLSKQIIEYANEKNKKYSASIITNGFLLNQKNADILEKSKVDVYQITLDGIEDTHNATRHLINGESTYNNIINNLKNVKIKGRIDIRHNLNENNYKESEELENIIKSIAKMSGNNINYYIALLNKESGVKKNKDNVNFLSHFNESEIESDKKSKDFFKGKLGRFCGAQSKNFIVIDEQGNLYKCWEDVDKLERSYGDIIKWDFFNSTYSSKCPNNILNYLNSIDYFQNDSECKDCVLVPICNGGCPNKRIFFDKKCLSFKDDIEKFSEKLAKFLVDNREEIVKKSIKLN